MALREEKWTFKEHLPYQAFYLAFYTGYMPVLLFLPLYLKYNGLSTTQVGLIAGLRPLLQAIGTPIVIKLATKFHARKLLFVTSCILMIGKFFMIFIILRPNQEICRMRLNDGQVESTYIGHSLTKRAVVMDEWLQVLNYTPNDLSLEYYDTNKVAKLQNNNSTDKNDSWPTVPSETKQPSGGQVSNATTTHTPAAQKNRVKITQYQIDHEHEVYLIFIAIIFLALATDYFDACIFTLVDNVYRPNVAWVWGDIAWGVMTLIIGVVLDGSAHEICGELIGSFHNIFYFNVAFVSIALLIGLRLDFTVDPRGADLTSTVQSSKWNFQYNIFILAYTLMGFCNGFLFSFVYWFIDILGGNAVIMGLSTSTECLVGILVFFLVNPIIEYIGHMSAVCVCFVGYIGLFLSYYGIMDPWLVIAVKVFQALISGTMMFTCNSFLKGAAPAGSSYQMQGNYNILYISRVQCRYRYPAIIGCLYLFLNYLKYIFVHCFFLYKLTKE